MMCPGWRCRRLAAHGERKSRYHVILWGRRNVCPLSLWDSTRRCTVIPEVLFTPRIPLNLPVAYYCVINPSGNPLAIVWRCTKTFIRERIKLCILLSTNT